MFMWPRSHPGGLWDCSGTPGPQDFDRLGEVVTIDGSCGLRYYLVADSCCLSQWLCVTKNGVERTVSERTASADLGFLLPVLLMLHAMHAMSIACERHGH